MHLGALVFIMARREGVPDVRNNNAWNQVHWLYSDPKKKTKEISYAAHMDDVNKRLK